MLHCINSNLQCITITNSILFAGFKATQVHKSCLSEQRAELASLFGVSDNETLAQIEVAEDGLATWTKAGGEQGRRETYGPRCNEKMG